MSSHRVKDIGPYELYYAAKFEDDTRKYMPGVIPNGYFLWKDNAVGWQNKLIKAWPHKPTDEEVQGAIALHRLGVP